MPNLPTPGGDDGTWAPILNDFLEVSLNSGSQSYVMYVQTVTGPSVGPAIMRVYAD